MADQPNSENELSPGDDYQRRYKEKTKIKNPKEEIKEKKNERKRINK